MRRSTSLNQLCALGLVLSMSCGEQVVVRETEASCGNGQVESSEACDDSNQVNTDSCTDSCKLAICGDGTTRTDLANGDDGFEACDDGNDVDTDGCTSACAFALCGDGIVRADLSEGSAASSPRTRAARRFPRAKPALYANSPAFGMGTPAEGISAAHASPTQ